MENISNLRLNIDSNLKNYPPFRIILRSIELLKNYTAINNILNLQQKPVKLWEYISNTPFKKQSNNYIFALGGRNNWFARFKRLCKFQKRLTSTLERLNSSNNNSHNQKQPPRGLPRKRCSEKMQQSCRRTPMPKCDFNKVAKQLYWVALRHGCYPVNLLPIFRTPFLKNTSGRLLLHNAQ